FVPVLEYLHLTWNPTQIVTMLEQILTGNPQQEVVNFLAGDLFLGNAKSKQCLIGIRTGYWLVQDQTVLGKDYSNMLIADSLLKTIWFINAPCYGNEALASPKANELTIPEQTATGKGISNPFMAGSLPKTTKPT
ncbi:hypothetical protein Tco_1190239, partial [Tanacetum coccineum]